MTPVSAPSTAPWLGEVAAFAQVLWHPGVRNAIQEQVRCARARFGQDDPIDVVVVLIGDALSGERILHASDARLRPCADTFRALFGRSRLPDRSILSRYLAALDQATVEARCTLFLADLVARTPFGSPGCWSDRRGNSWWVMDVDGTTHAARQRALPTKPGLPAPPRRLSQICAPGSTGRTRGDVVRTRTTGFQACTHHWIGTSGGSGHGKDRSERKRALEAITWDALAHARPLARMLIRKVD